MVVVLSKAKSIKNFPKGIIYPNSSYKLFIWRTLKNKNYYAFLNTLFLDYNLNLSIVPNDGTNKLLIFIIELLFIESSKNK